MLLDIDTATHQQLLDEYDDCWKSWGMYSCDCFGFYMDALQNKITILGGWPIKK